MSSKGLKLVKMALLDAKRRQENKASNPPFQNVCLQEDHSQVLNQINDTAVAERGTEGIPNSESEYSAAIGLSSSKAPSTAIEFSALAGSSTTKESSLPAGPSTTTKSASLAGPSTATESQTLEGPSTCCWGNRTGNNPSMVLKLRRRREPHPENNDSDSDSSNTFDSDDSVADPGFSASSSSSSGTSSVSSGSTSETSKHSDEDDNVENDSVAANSPENTKKGKRKIADKGKWKKNRAKYLRNTGRKYTSVSQKKTVIPQKEMGLPCSDKCRIQCASKISEIQRREIFHKYWAIGSLQLQREFLSKCLTEVRPRYNYKREGSNRRCNHAFHFVVNNEKVRVCKTFFKSTLAINDRPIRTVITKSRDGFLEPDLRGKHHHHKKTDPALIEGVVAHINSIPRIESHYLRAQTTREYIDGGKTLADLYRDYKQVCIQKGQSHVSLTMYSRTFNEKFNISFFTPKKDQCEECTEFKNAGDEEKSLLKDKYDRHLKEKGLSRAEKENDKQKAKESNGRVVAACYDLQAVLQVPRGDISTFYYKCKINCYNFTISDLCTDHVSSFFWHEGEGNRGAIEISTCVFKYLESVAQVAPDENTEVVLFSDNCCGQQKNKYIMGMYLYAVQHLNLKSITHKFLIRGHTQNEGDNVHSVIEKSVKRQLRSGPIYIPADYVRIIKSARKTGNPYNVYEITHDEFIDFKDVTEKIGYNYNKTTEGEIVKTGEIKVLEVRKSDPDSIFVKTSYEHEVFKKIEVKNTKKRTRREDAARTIQLQRAYKKKPCVNDRKKSDIEDLFRANAIPKGYKSVYDAIFN